MYSVLKYINEHIGEPLTAANLAEHFGYSPWYFSDLFHRFTGTVFCEYIRHQRMQLAAMEVLDGEKIVDIAMKYGYETQSGFNKAFLKEFGCLPREFKKKNGLYHIEYGERRKQRMRISARCNILRERVVSEKTCNRKILAQHAILFEEGIWKHLQRGDGGGHTRIAAGMENVMMNSMVVIQEGELLVGYNYADTPYPEFWTPKDTSEDLKLVLEAGFTEEQFRKYLEHHEEVLKYWQYDRHAWNYNATHDVEVFDGQFSFLKDFSKKELEMDDEWAAIGRCMSDNHTIIGYEKVLKKGFSGLLEDIEAAEKINGTSDMYEAMKMLCKAAGILGERYADEAVKIAGQANCTPERKGELKKIAAICRKVPKYPAETFHEALQSLFFTHVFNTWEDGINANSLGRLDQILYPYYKKDMEEGRITKDEAFELICCLWIKFYRDYDVQQSCIGGCDREGKDAINELSYMMLDATEGLDFIRCLSVRFHSGTDKEFIKRALEVVGHVQKGVPFFFNDAVIIPALVSQGIDIEDAREYTQIGCVETVLPGMSNPHAVSGETNLLKAMEYVLANGRSMFESGRHPGLETGKRSDLWDYSMFRAAVYKQIENIISITCKKVYLWMKAAEVYNPKPYKSLLSDDCIIRNKDFNNHGVKYDFYQIMLGGVPNLADSMLVVKKFVYDEKKYSLDYLYQQLMEDFPDEAFRQECLHKVAKFGNDIDEVDEIAADIVHFSCDVLEKKSAEYGIRFHAQPFTFLWMLDHGKVTAATPDGRKKGEIIAYSVSPMQGRDFCGFTAVLNSLSKLPTRRCPGTTSAIIEVEPKLFTDSNIEKFADILLASAEKGLCNVQFNTVDAETMLDAQKHPEFHNNLAVRVSGFSQKFNLLERPMQDHIIGRTKHKVL